MPKCPLCKKELVSEFDVSRLGFETMVGYFIESGLRAVVGSGRAPYWCCMNPRCRVYSGGGDKPFWFRVNAVTLQMEPTSFAAREMGIYPKRNRRR